ncbi:MAG: hypothetical protein E7Z86_05215 [Methanosphaera stadtmanae]|nr:hypothetical protein [Methanosphaera stadtmanae]
MDVTTVSKMNVSNIELNTVNISTFLDFIRLPFERLKIFKNEEYSIFILIDSVNFLSDICDRYLPKISTLLVNNNELSNTLFYDFMDCWSMINHILIVLNDVSNNILSNDVDKLTEDEVQNIYCSLNFINRLLSDFSNVLNCKIFDLQNDSNIYEDNYILYKSKLEEHKKLFNDKFYTGLNEPDKSMKELLAMEFIEN